MMYGTRGTRPPAKTLLSGLAIVLLLILLTACGDKTAVQPLPTPTAPLLPFTVIDIGIPAQALNAPVTGSVPDSQILHVGISFNLNSDTLNKLKNQAAKVGSNNDVTGSANSLGITDQEYQQMKTYFGIEGATLTLGKLHTFLSIDAKASTFAKLFQTRFVMHKLNNRTFFTPDATMPPKLPTVIATQILSVTGLDNYSAPVTKGSAFFPHLPQVAQYTRHTNNTRTSADCTADSRTLSMQQIAHAYGYDNYWRSGFHGENMTINLVETDTFNSSDVAFYFSCYNVPQSHLQVFNIDGQPASADGESNLDIDMIAGLAPGAQIRDYQTGSPSFNDVNVALQQIVNDYASHVNTASVVSISLGAWEGQLTSGMLKTLNSSLLQLTQVEHMTVFVASGDCGAFVDQTYNSLSVSFPASDPYVVAVGGTEMTLDNRGYRTQETVWSNGSDRSQCNNFWGSGGGVSTAFAKPSWQQGSGVYNRYSTGKRQLPDIAAVALPIAVYVNGQWDMSGGTSAATPIWAAGMMLVNQALEKNTGGTFVYGPDLFYVVANNTGGKHPFFDVTQGNNLYYPATRGWDNATGLGTPNLVDFGDVIYNLLQQQH